MKGNLSKKKAYINTKSYVDRLFSDYVIPEHIVRRAQLEDALALKQDNLTFDDAPVQASANPVKSGGVKAEFEKIKYYGDPDIIPSDESYFVVNETGETITGLTEDGKTQAELVIPYNVTRIGTEVFSECTSLTSITIPNSVTSIGDSAFNGCTSLTSINIPNSVTSIGDNVFFECASLTSINIPNSVTSIGTGAFYGCTKLTIYCEQGSYAETYAKDKGFNIVYTDISKTVLNNKVDKETGKGLSANDFTDDYKTKLEGIAENAEVNVQSDWNQTDTAADDYIKNKPKLSADNISYLPYSESYSVLGVETVEDALNIGLIPPTVTTMPSDGLQPQKIYDFGKQTSLTIILPSDDIYMFIGGEWLQVDFVSGDTPTNLTIDSSGAYMTPLDLTIKPNKLYSLFFDHGRVSDINYGWRISYAEYDFGVY